MSIRPNPGRRADAQSQLVLAKALKNVALELELTLEDVADIIGKSTSSLSRLFSNPALGIKPGSKEAELTLLLIRAYRSLSAILGDNSMQIRAWFHSSNSYFQDKPLEVSKQVEGLVNVCAYLDSMRAKV